MGYIKHHAIVVTSWDNELLEKVHDRARDIFNGTTALLTLITPATINGYASFLIAPDGSKEGWAESDIGNEKRKEFIDWIEVTGEMIGHPMSLNYIEVQFGDDHGETKIIRHSD